jgi:hypothetical protein
MEYELCVQRPLCTGAVAHDAVNHSLHEAGYGAVGVALLDTELHPAICICWIYEPSAVAKIGDVQRRGLVNTPIVLGTEMCELAN